MVARLEPNKRDWSTRSNAMDLAHVVKAYWRRKEFQNVEVWVEQLKGFDSHFVLRSNLVNGKPPR